MSTNIHLSVHEPECHPQNSGFLFRIPHPHFKLDHVQIDITIDVTPRDDLPGGSRIHAAYTTAHQQQQQQHRSGASAETKYFIHAVPAIAQLLAPTPRITGTTAKSKSNKSSSQSPASPEQHIPHLAPNHHRFAQTLQKRLILARPHPSTPQNGNVFPDRREPRHRLRIRTPTLCQTHKHHHRRRTQQIRRPLRPRSSQHTLQYPHCRVRRQQPGLSIRP